MIKSRPFFLTLACWLLIGYGSYHLVTSFAHLNNPSAQAEMALIGAPYLVQVVVLYLNALVLIVTGIAMLEEKNWARWVYLGWGFVYSDYNLYVAPDWHSCAILIAAYLITAVIMIVPSANEYFSSNVLMDD